MKKAYDSLGNLSHRAADGGAIPPCLPIDRCWRDQIGERFRPIRLCSGSSRALVEGRCDPPPWRGPKGDSTRAKREPIWLLLALLLPAVSGCSGSGGILSLLGNLFRGGGSSSGSGLAELIDSSPGTLATIHSPEPGTMLLMGSGLLAMAFANRKRITRRNK